MVLKIDINWSFMYLHKFLSAKQHVCGKLPHVSFALKNHGIDCH